MKDEYRDALLTFVKFQRSCPGLRISRSIQSAPALSSEKRPVCFTQRGRRENLPHHDADAFRLLGANLDKRRPDDRGQTAVLTFMFLLPGNFFGSYGRFQCSLTPVESIKFS